MENTHGIQGAKIALLIDFDNVILGVEDPGFDVELVVNALRARGIVVMGRAYGDWYRHHRHRRKLMEQGIELVETPVFGPVIKNSADIRIVLDGIDVALAHTHIDTFCLVSGDSDFLPLIKRLQLLGKNVIVIAGQKFTSELVRRNCNEYIAYENLFAESIGATEDVSTLDGACQLLQRAINTLLERGMDARSSTVKQMMLQMNPAFSERTFGCSQFKQFLDKATRTGAFKLGERDSHSGEFAVLLTESVEIARTEASEKGAREESNGRRRERGRERRETVSRESQNGQASTREAPGELSPEVAISQTPISIEDQLLAESGATLSTSGDKLQTRGTLRRGRLKFSAKAGVSSVAPAAPESDSQPDAPAVAEPDAQTLTPSNAATVESQTPESVAETPREYSQDAAPETSESEAAQVAPAPAESAETDAPKRRTTRGGRRRKPKSEAENAASESASAAPENVAEENATPLSEDGASAAEAQTELDGGATSLEGLPEVAPQTAGSDETLDLPFSENLAPQGDAGADAATSENSDGAPDENAEPEKDGATPKRRTTRGGRRKRPATRKEE